MDDESMSDDELGPGPPIVRRACTTCAGDDDSTKEKVQRQEEIQLPVGGGEEFFKEPRPGDTEVAQLNALIGDESAGQDIRDRAREKLLQLTEWMEQETTVEGVLRARGFTDPLVTVHADSVNVLVRQEILSQADAARILELTTRETGQGGGNIKIIPIQ
jgi:hypothetical protein